jgi:hypothetical protein
MSRYNARGRFEVPALAQQATGSGGALFTERGVPRSVFVKWHFSVLFPLPVPSTRTVRHQSRFSAYLPRTPSMTALASVLARALIGRSILAIQFGPDPLGLRGMIWTYLSHELAGSHPWHLFTAHQGRFAAGSPINSVLAAGEVHARVRSYSGRALA